jgi:ketosteroid isomerase-like protein
LALTNSNLYPLNEKTMTPNPSHILSNNSRAPTATEAAVLQAMHALSAACLGADRAAITALTSPSLTYSHSDGHIQMQEMFIHSLETGHSGFKKIELLDISVQLAGNLALVSHHALYNTFNQGQDGTADLRVNQVWTLDTGNWRLLLRQARKTQVPA